MTVRIRKGLVLVSVLAVVSGCIGQTVERVGLTPSDIPDAVRQAIEQKGHRVGWEKGATVDFWFAKSLATLKKETPGALYPQLSDGEFVGIVKFAQTFADFRGQSIPAGIYTLRYQLLPQDGNHLGIAPNPDFLLAIPMSADSQPEQTYEYRRLVALSARSTGGNHPAVIALENAGQAGTITKTDNGMVFTVAIPAGSKTEVIGICLTCSASQ